MAHFSLDALLGQLMVGLVNGAFYAMLSLGLALIFGMLNVVNFAHGAQYMLGAIVAWLLLDRLGLGYGWALLLAPLAVGALAAGFERLALRRIARLDHLYGLLLTFGLAMALEGGLTVLMGAASRPYAIPEFLRGAIDLGFMIMPRYRLWVVLASAVTCLLVWLAVERTRLGSYLRAATENAALVRAFGVRVPLLITLTYGFGAALAAFSGVMAAPILQISPTMGSSLLAFVFAVVVIGGMGSIGGAVISGFAMGVIEGLTKYFWPEASSTVVFVMMAVILLVRPNGLFGRTLTAHAASAAERPKAGFDSAPYRGWLIGVLALGFALAPLVFFPTTAMTVMCMALFALSFNLLVGYAGLVSFGHAMFFGTGAYVCAHAAAHWGLPVEACLLLGVACSAALAWGAGALAIRRQGVYFAMITLALSQMVFFFYLKAPFTGGEDGIQRVPRGALLGWLPLEGWTLYAFVWAVFIAGFLLVYRIIHSPFGEVLTAIRDNEDRAVSLGYDVGRYKLAAFVMAGALAGLAGSMKALVQQMASLADAHMALSSDVILMALLGGMGTIFGPVVGAVALVGMQNQLATLGAWVVFIQGVILMLCVLLFRRGLVGAIANQWNKPL